MREAGWLYGEGGKKKKKEKKKEDRDGWVLEALAGYRGEIFFAAPFVLEGKKWRQIEGPHYDTAERFTGVLVLRCNWRAQKLFAMLADVPSCSPMPLSSPRGVLQAPPWHARDNITTGLQGSQSAGPWVELGASHPPPHRVQQRICTPQWRRLLMGIHQPGTP